MLDVPADGLFEALFEGRGGLEAEFLLGSGGVGFRNLALTILPGQ